MDMWLLRLKGIFQRVYGSHEKTLNDAYLKLKKRNDIRLCKKGKVVV